jgi:two-component SAPR family response regulator
LASLKNNENYNNNSKVKQDSKIMVLDDDFDIATLVKITLQKNGFKNVFAFTKPSLALEHFKINCDDYCLVITDIRMPEMNGFEFAKAVSQIKPGIKILLTTAFDIDDDALVTMNGMYKNNIAGIIQKPVSPNQLARIIIAKIGK